MKKVSFYKSQKRDKYATTNEATCSIEKKNFRTYEHSKCKSAREDFNDMFTAEDKHRREVGDLSIVFCLTYNDEHIRYKYGQNMLDASDLAVFAKSSKWSKMLRRSFGYQFDMVSVGEYGCGGETHNVKGVRGSGQNPHFHCVGYFHKLEDVPAVDSVNKLSEIGFLINVDGRLSFIHEGVQYFVTIENFASLLSIILPYLVRFAWQGDFSEIETYGRDAVARSKGFGFVKLSGEVRSSVAGSSYIGKYIGKDIRNIWYKAYKAGFCPAFLSIAVSAVSDCIFGRSLSENEFKYFLPLPECLCDVAPDSSSAVLKHEYCMRVIRHWAFNRRRWIKGDVDCYRRNYEYDHSRLWQRDFGLFFKWIGVDDMELPKELATFFPAVCDALDDCYCDFYDEFNEDLNGRYSPKVRKFHGFGYSLLADADLSDGTYLVNTARRVVNRRLPPSLHRKVFYDYHVVFSRDKYGNPCKSVKYTLNDVGRQYLKKTLSAAVDIDCCLARSKGSENLKRNAEKAAIFRNCVASYDVTAESLLSVLPWLCNKDSAIAYAISCRQSECFWANVSENRCFVDIKKTFKELDPDTFTAYEELNKIHFEMLDKKNARDKEHNSNWLCVYGSQY